MFDIIPWLDETYVVEMGRLFLCGGDLDSILLSRSNVVMIPWHYIGPLIQECSFRLLGQLGVRISPVLGLLAMWLCFRTWLGKSYRWNAVIMEMTGLLLLTSPLVFQSVILGRPDAWPLAFSFAALAVLGRPDGIRGKVRIFIGAFFATASVFAWPSSVLTAIMYPAFCFDVRRKREFLWFCLFGAISAIIIAIPVMPNFGVVIDSFVQHSNDTAPRSIALMEVLVMMAREFARSPFLSVIGIVGLFAWMKNRRYMAIAALLCGFALAVKTGLYAFRLVYLTPVFALMCADAIDLMLNAHRKTVAFWTLLVAVVYGVVSGPIGHLLIDYPRLPDGLRENLAKVVGTGPVVVFAPDFATYYIGRELGWRQLGFAAPENASDAELVKSVCGRADAVVLREWDPYETTQQSFTPYGLFCKYVLRRARQEASVPDSQKSWFARFGSRFAGVWHCPIALDAFDECGRFDMIRVYVRRRSGDVRYRARMVGEKHDKQHCNE